MTHAAFAVTPRLPRHAHAVGLAGVAALLMWGASCQPRGGPAGTAPGANVIEAGDDEPGSRATAEAEPATAPEAETQVREVVDEVPASAFYAAALAAPAPTVTAEELQALLAEGAVLIDVRSPSDFVRERIRGAISMPATDLTPERIEAVVPTHDTVIVVYCDVQLFPSRRIAVATLAVPTFQQLGYRDVRVLEHLWARPSHPLAMDTPE